jgi:cytochrome c peroxidase
MRKSAPILVLSAAISAATFFSCQKNVDPVTSGTEVLEMPATPYRYFGSLNGTATILDKKAALGRVLFYDKNLSVNNSVACASCHKQAFAFADNVAFSRGFENRLTTRNSMPLENLPGKVMSPGASIVSLFWDGRATSLEDLVLQPVGNHIEMGITDVSTLPAKLSKVSYYPELFKGAYGDEAVTNDRISEAVALFMESIVSKDSKFDKVEANIQNAAQILTPLELYGMQLFDNKYDCRSCHSLNNSMYISPSPTNFVDIGLDDVATDKGRSAVSAMPSDEGKFRVPNLHNVALTAPYMHDGRFLTLEEVIDHYSHKVKASKNLDPRLTDLQGKPKVMNISADEKKALVAFLHTFTDPKMISDPRFSNPFKFQQP